MVLYQTSHLALVTGDGPSLTQVVRVRPVTLGVGYEGGLKRLSRGEPHILRGVAGRRRRQDGCVCHGATRGGPDVQGESLPRNTPVRGKPNLHSTSLGCEENVTGYVTAISTVCCKREF